MALQGISEFLGESDYFKVRTHSDTFAGDMTKAYVQLFSKAQIGAQIFGSHGEVTVMGLEQAKENVRTVWQVAIIASASGSERMANEVMKVSQAMCPYDEGTLCWSAKVEGEGVEAVANPDFDMDNPEHTGPTGISPTMMSYPLGAITGRGRREMSAWHRVLYNAEHALLVHENVRGYPDESFQQNHAGSPPKWEGHPKGPRFLKRALDALAPRLGNKVQRILQASIAQAISQMKTTVDSRALGMGVGRLVKRKV